MFRLICKRQIILMNFWPTMCWGKAFMPVHVVVAFFTITFALQVLAADNTHEAAARKYYSTWMKTDKRLFLQSFAGIAGATNQQTQAIALALLESPEYELIFVKHLKNIYTEVELLSLIDLANTPAFRLFNERMPHLVDRTLPEVRTFYSANYAELSRRATEKQISRRLQCLDNGPRELPGGRGESVFDVLPKAERIGYICDSVLEDKFAKSMFVTCTNQKTMCDDFAVINFRYDTTTLKLESINAGRTTALIEALSKQGRFTAGNLPPR